MAKKRFGKLPPRYLFALNPYKETRFSRCPKCERLTYPRKFPLLIVVPGHGLFVLGKTCRYCPKCEFIIAHQDELDSVLTTMFPERTRDETGKEYFVLGTVQTRVWRKALDDPSSFKNLEDIREHTADIKRYMEVKYEPGGWGFAGKTET
ncbi:hypothetical protein [Methylocaldum sp.]|jgi:hypothetical protein|uniref:hypothetical protein n=1 Tax=Methylocaldum sp. TaxID=1969727 RepID=UPI0032209F6B